MRNPTPASLTGAGFAPLSEEMCGVVSSPVLAHHPHGEDGATDENDENDSCQYAGRDLELTQPRGVFIPQQQLERNSDSKENDAEGNPCHRSFAVLLPAFFVALAQCEPRHDYGGKVRYYQYQYERPVLAQPCNGIHHSPMEFGAPEIQGYYVLYHFLSKITRCSICGVRGKKL